MRRARSGRSTVALTVATRFGTALLVALTPAVVQAQSGTGTTAGTVLAIPAGGRSAGMAGAYAAGTDVDALFYNPAAAAWLDRAAAFSYQRHVQDIGFASAAAAADIGPVAAALTLGFLDFGSIREVRPDPDYDGERGLETGALLDAAETTINAVIAVPLLDGRLALGASAGLLMVAVAETGRTTAMFDAGAQLRLRPGATVAVVLRRAGPGLTGAGLGEAPLPTELRIGSACVLPFAPARDVHLTANVDVVVPLRDRPVAPVVGAEALYAPDERPFAAALRAGFNGATGAAGLGRVHVGGGVQVAAFALDYVFQAMGALGPVHRIGVRWSH